MRSNRHNKILELIKHNNIYTQKELSDILTKEGFEVTQSTLSRDLRELNLSKISTTNGKQKYVVLNSKTDDSHFTKLCKIFKNSVISINYAQNIVIIKTLDGIAMALATTLENINYSEIIGSIAGDNTIFLATKNDQYALALVEKLKKFLEN